MIHSIEKSTRVNKALQELGYASRRDADKKISAGLVFVNKKRAELGVMLVPGDKLEIKGGKLEPKYALYNKPRGEITGISLKNKLIGLHPVGRLDNESEGLLIYTNDYTLTDKLLNPDNEIEKEYRVKVREKMTPRVETILRAGITTKEANYKPVKNIKISEDSHTLTLTITEGKKHEIRRMLNALNLTIDSLIRIRINRLKILNMKPGQVQDISLADIV